MLHVFLICNASFPLHHLYVDSCRTALTRGPSQVCTPLPQPASGVLSCGPSPVQASLTSPAMGFTVSVCLFLSFFFAWSFSCSFNLFGFIWAILSPIQKVTFRFSVHVSGVVASWAHQLRTDSEDHFLSLAGVGQGERSEGQKPTA